MSWLNENWFWVVIAILFVGMHFFAHGGHGGGGCCGGHGHGSSGNDEGGKPEKHQH